MSTYRFTHRSNPNEIYHGTECGDYVEVKWYATEGHDTDGESRFRTSDANHYLNNGMWKLVEQPANLCLETPLPGEALGIARPILEERKLGKVQVTLVDRGFPNALMEVARVMTWAGEVKGYKPHDWKNLPDAEDALEGAASRHRMEHNTARAAGESPKDILDHESKLLHKAHEAFNVLAELELIITGKIV